MPLLPNVGGWDDVAPQLMATLISSTMLREDEEYLALELQAETADFIDRMRAAFEEEFKKMLDAMQSVCAQRRGETRTLWGLHGDGGGS